MLRTWVLALATLACTPPEAADDTSACDNMSPMFDIGTGEAAYEPTEPGDIVSMVNGPQGGWHLPIGLTATGLTEVDRVLVHFEALIEGEVHADQGLYVTFRCDASQGRYEAWDLHLMYDRTPEQLHQQISQVTATLEQPHGDLVARTTFEIDDPEQP